MQRNRIYEALKAQLTAGLLNVNPFGVQVVSRGFVHWDAADLQPAIYIDAAKEDGAYTRGTPVKWTLRLNIWVYAKWTDTVDQGTQIITTLMDGVDYVLSPDGPNGSKNAAGAVNTLGQNGPMFGLTPAAANTLGGLVSYCALAGSGDVSAGYLNGNQCIARMPVEILVAG